MKLNNLDIKERFIMMNIRFKYGSIKEYRSFRCLHYAIISLTNGNPCDIEITIRSSKNRIINVIQKFSNSNINNLDRNSSLPFNEQSYCEFSRLLTSAPARNYKFRTASERICYFHL